MKVHTVAVNPANITRSQFVKDETFLIVGVYDVSGVIAAVMSDIQIGDRVMAEITGGAALPKKNGSFAEFCASPRTRPSWMSSSNKLDGDDFEDVCERQVESGN